MIEDWVVHHRRGLEFPVRQGPLKFAVRMPDGSTSNSWRVWTTREDAYVCCRDNMKEIKISLHRSGKQHVAFREEDGIQMTPGSRFWNKWREPQQQNPAVPSFKLAFPPWGVRLSGEDRKKTKKISQVWEGNQILMDGDDELVVSVSCIILPASKRLNFKGPHPHALLGQLPFAQGKDLFVVASKEPVRNLRTVVEAALAKISVSRPETVQAALDAQSEGEVLTACLTGDNPEGYAFMVVVPVRATPGRSLQSLEDCTDIAKLSGGREPL